MGELFDLDLQSKAGLQAASNREVLAAMLAAVRDGHWCKAVGCHPEPGLMTSISLQTVAIGKVQPVNGYDISRALAAAERRLFLLPESRCATCSTLTQNRLTLQLTMRASQLLTAVIMMHIVFADVMMLNAH